MSDRKRILVVKLSSLGDIFHALPAVAELRTCLNAEVDWAVQPAFAPIVQTFSCVSEVVEVPRPSNFVEWLKALVSLRRRGTYDLVVDFQGIAKSAVVSRVAKSAMRIGPSFAHEGSWLVYSKLSAPREKVRTRHAVDECLDILPCLGFPRPARPVFPFEAPAMNLLSWVNEAGGRTSAPAVAVAPYSRWASKDWPEAHYSEAIRLLYEKGLRVFVIGGPDDREGAARIIAAAGVPAANLCGRLTIPQSAGVLHECAALLTNDSGPMHIAAALGVPCVAFFGPTEAGRTGPFGPRHVILRAKVCDAPCRKRVCPKGTQACLQAIAPAVAVEKILSVLENRAPEVPAN